MHQPPPRLLPSPSLRPLSHSLLAKTEFIYQPPPASPPPTRVTLHGDWDNFRPHQLHPETPTLFSRILIIPTGPRHFYFHVDNVRRLSHLHPLTPCRKHNTRRVHAPVKTATCAAPSPSRAFVTWAEARLARCGVVADVPSRDVPPLPVVCAGQRPRLGRPWYRGMCWPECVVVVCAAYLVLAAAVALVGGK